MESLQIYTRDLELNDRLRDYVESKVSKFERYLPKLDSVRVDLSESNARDSSQRMVAQITVYVPRAILRAEERAGDIFSAVDSVMDKMYRRIERYKGRRQQARRATAEVFQEALEEEEDLYEEESDIVRVKEFEVSAIPPEDAVEQMELLGHHFYVFLDGTDGRLSVVYKRKNGDYGLLKPRY
ncbi:MAG: ribosome-associated translation inhibitor RaiA [Chloroflexi bacterium]|jgi:putative sigma-54 modulation protein|nr:ribosome-associated translation inhibitor RaiA [Chloroflexota bacterium]